MPTPRVPEDDRLRDVMLSVVHLDTGEAIGYAMNRRGWYLTDTAAGWNSRGMVLLAPYTGPSAKPSHKPKGKSRRKRLDP